MSSIFANKSQSTQLADAPASKGPSQHSLAINVPSHLEGRPWKTLTAAEHFEIKKYRMGRLLCEGCGFSNHPTTKCRRLSKTHKQREAKGLCLECASPKHDWNNCTKRRAIEKQLGPIAKSGEVRPSFVGLAYKYMAAWEKKDVRTYRKVHNRCLCCGGTHVLFDCPKRNRRVKGRLEQQKRDIASGKLEIKSQFTSTLAVLPVELRLQIWADVTKDTYDVQVSRGFMPEYMISSGLPFREMLEVWLQNNVFSMSTKQAFHRFDRLLTAFNGHKFVHSIKLPWLFSPGFLDWDINEAMPCLKRCTSLYEVNFVVSSSVFRKYWLQCAPHDGSTINQYGIFNTYTKNLLRDFAAHEGLRHVVVRERAYENSRHWRRPDNPDDNTIQRMIQGIRDVFENSGHSDIEVDDGQAVPQHIAAEEDNDGDDDGW